MKEFFVYTVARIGLLVLALVLVAVVYALVGGEGAMPWFWLLLIAIVISAIASVYLLRGPRARFAAVVERRAAGASRRFEQARAKEDEPDEPGSGRPASGEPGEPGEPRADESEPGRATPTDRGENRP